MSAQQPLFSIISITLNCADAAVVTAQTVLEQRYNDYEYLVQDGGSTDGTVDRLTALGIREIVSAPDNGIYNAMNRAIARSRGIYLCFMNAGDRFAGSEVLAAVADAIRRHDNPEMLYGDVRSFSSHPLITAGVEQAELGREISYPEQLSRFYLFRKMICHQAWFVRRDVYTALGGLDERYALLADYAFLMKLSSRPGIRRVHVPSQVAVFQGGGASESAVERHAAERRAIQAWAFSPLERIVYGAAYSCARTISSEFVYRRLYPLLPLKIRGRLNGW